MLRAIEPPLAGGDVEARSGWADGPQALCQVDADVDALVVRDRDRPSPQTHSMAAVRSNITTNQPTFVDVRSRCMGAVTAERHTLLSRRTPCIQSSLGPASSRPAYSNSVGRRRLIPAGGARPLVRIFCFWPAVWTWRGTSAQLQQCRGLSQQSSFGGVGVAVAIGLSNECVWLRGEGGALFPAAEMMMMMIVPHRRFASACWLAGVDCC